MKTLNKDRTTSRKKRILASLVLVIGIAALVWLYPNLFSGKEDPQTYLLQAQTQTIGDELSDLMSHANSVMFSRLTALGLVDFNIEQSGPDHLAVTLTPEGNSPQQALAAEHAADLLCRPGAVQFIAADGTTVLENRHIKKASLNSDQDNSGFTIIAELTLTGSDCLQAAREQAAGGSGLLVSTQSSIQDAPDDPAWLSVVLDGAEAVSCSLDTETGSSINELYLVFPKEKEQEAKDLTALLNSPPLPCPFERQSSEDGR